MTRTLVFERDDGSQILVTLWDDDSVEVAERCDPRIAAIASWTLPLTLVSEEQS